MGLDKYNWWALQKTKGGASRNPKSSKYFVSTCQDRISKKDWIQVQHSLKPLQNYDKSMVLKGVLEKHTNVIVKLGDNNEIKHEYEMGKLLSKVKGFVKFICFFQCNDDFLQYPKTTLCQGDGSSMQVIVMPYFEMGPLSGAFNVVSTKIFTSCLKHAVMSIIDAFFIANIGHNDFHVGNVVLKKTSQRKIVYQPFPNKPPFEIETNGVRTWIMDFEKSAQVDNTSMVARDWFLYDLKKFFMMIPTLVKGTCPSNFQAINSFLNSIDIVKCSQGINHVHVVKLLELIDAISFDFEN